MSKPLLFSDVYEALAALSSTGHAYGDDGCFRVFYAGASAECCLVVQTSLSTFPSRDMRDVSVRSLRVGIQSYANPALATDTSRYLEFKTPTSLSLVSQVATVLQDLCASCCGGIPDRTAIVDQAVVSLQSLGFVLGDFPIYGDN